MSEEEDKPDRQLEAIKLSLGTGVKDSTKENKPTWTLRREIGKGAFGTVYHATNETSRQEAALKVETMTAGDNLLKIEREIMLAMRNEPNAIHIFDDGIYTDFRFIVMTLCGPDLEKLAELMNNKFTKETVLRVSIRTLLAVKTLHEYEYVHRDLKPCNFALDYLPNSHHIYLFDYGMARRYARKDSSGNYYLRRPREQVQFRGTIRFCSLNMHNRKELGRVDDIWSWLYMLVEMHVPLPWSHTVHQEKAEAQKQELFTEFLTKDPFLANFLPILKLLNSWEYADRPDYGKLFEILYVKLRELNGKLCGPNEFDERISTFQAEQEKNLFKVATEAAPKEKEEVKPEDEENEQKIIFQACNKVIIPGGASYVLPEGADFFGNLCKRVPEKVVEKEKKEEKKDEKKEDKKEEKKEEKKDDRKDDKKEDKKEEKTDEEKKKKMLFIGPMLPDKTAKLQTNPRNKMLGKKTSNGPVAVTPGTSAKSPAVSKLNTAKVLTKKRTQPK
uniref:Protein kinase domain-containing protein n=1 Tax=Caenorhabditis japonica TaxID=281687 RepID=A0A8R1HYU5_CAEJA